MKEDFRFALMLAVVISPCVIVGNVLSQFVASSINRPAAACPGECCPCDAVDAHVVAKWLDEHRDDVSIIAARSYDADHHSYAGPAFKLVEVNTKAYRGHLILVGVDHHTDSGEAPVGELEGDE